MIRSPFLKVFLRMLYRASIWITSPKLNAIVRFFARSNLLKIYFIKSLIQGLQLRLPDIPE